MWFVAVQVVEHWFIPIGDDGMQAVFADKGDAEEFAKKLLAKRGMRFERVKICQAIR